MIKRIASSVAVFASMLMGAVESSAAPDLYPYKWPDTMMHEVLVHTAGDLTQDQVKDNSTVEDGVLLDLAEVEDGVDALVGVPLYFSFAIINAGDSIGTSFTIEVFLNDELIATKSRRSGLDEGYAAFYSNLSIDDDLAPGVHTLRVVVDASEKHAESNEENNVYERTFRIVEGGGPDLKPFAYGEMPAELFFHTREISSDEITDGIPEDVLILPPDGTDAQKIHPYEQVYFSFAHINIGNLASEPCAGRVLLDGDAENPLYEFDVMALDEAGGVEIKRNAAPPEFTNAQIGDHTLTLQLDPGGAVEETDEGNNEHVLDFTVVENPDAVPDLAERVPDGWDGSIVVSTEGGTNTDAPAEELKGGVDLFVDFAFWNEGGKNIEAEFKVVLSLIAPDDQVTKIGEWSIASLVAKGWVPQTDVELRIIDAGEYRLKLELDPEGAVADEVDVDDNVIERTITILPGDGLPDLSAHTPVDWGGSMMLSTETGTVVDGDPALIKSGVPLYLDFAFKNGGLTHIVESFQSKLSLIGPSPSTDVTELHLWDANDGLNVDSFISEQDHEISLFLDPGEYTLKLELDVNDDIGEMNEDNNVLQKVFVVNEGEGDADLAAFQPEGWGDSVVASNDAGDHVPGDEFPLGTPIYVDFAFANVGLAHVPDGQAFLVGLEVFDPNGQPVELENDSWTFDQGLRVNTYKVIEDIPFVVYENPGDYVWRFTIDVNGVVDEGETGNNIVERTIAIAESDALPDLQCWQPDDWSDCIVVSHAQDTTVDGDALETARQLYVDFCIANLGGRNFDQSFDVELVIERPDETRSVLGSFRVEGGIEVGYSRKYLDVFSGDTLIYTPGDYTFELHIDKQDEVDEGDADAAAEQNNVVRKTVAIAQSQTAAPDLQVMALDGWSAGLVLSHATGGHEDAATFYTTRPMYVDFAVVNTGTAHAGAVSSAELHLVRPDATSELLGSFEIPALNVQTGTTVEDFEIPYLLYEPGDYELRLEVDADDAVTGELDEDNNVFVKQFTVAADPDAGPQLTPYIVDGWSSSLVVTQSEDAGQEPAQFVTGQPLFIDFAVANVGDAHADVDFDCSLVVARQGGEDVSLGTHSVAGLDVGQYTSFENVTSAQTVFYDPGTYTITLTIDVDNTVDNEKDETDNALVRTIEIVTDPDAAPDLALHTPEEWTSTIIVSQQPGGQAMADVFLTGLPLYVDYGVKNAGGVHVDTAFDVELHLLTPAGEDLLLGEQSFTDQFNAQTFQLFEDMTSDASIVYEPGDYTLRLLIDPDEQVVDETNRANNVVELDIVFVDNPDAYADIEKIVPAGWGDSLIVAGEEGATADQAPIYAGAPVYVSLAFHNGGVRHVEDQFQSALFMTPPGGQERLVATWNTAGLQVGAMVQVENFQLPLVYDSGEVGLRLVLDHGDLVEEGDDGESDNVVQKSFDLDENAEAKPDLLPYAPDGWPSAMIVSKNSGTATEADELFAGVPLFIDFSWSNAGLRHVEDDFKTSLYVTGPDDGGEDKVGEWWTYGGLNVGAHSTIADVSLTYYTPGEYTFKFVIDDGNAVDDEESDENNEFVRQVTLLENPDALPDLVPHRPQNWDSVLFAAAAPDATQAEDQVPAGIPFYANFAISNVGNKAVAADAAFGYELHLLDSANNRTMLEQWTHEAGLPVQTPFMRQNIPITLYTPGEYTLQLILDSADELAELDNSNNIAQAVVEVAVNPDAGPDLAGYAPDGWDGSLLVSRQSGDHSQGDGFLTAEQLYVDFAFLNQGNAHVADDFDVILEMTTPGGETVRIDEYSESRLDVGSFKAYTDVHSSHTQVYTPGDYTFRVVLDAAGDAGEDDDARANNVLEQSISVSTNPDAHSDLAAATPAGWPGEIVVSREPGTSENAQSLLTGESFYVDFAVRNAGAAHIADDFSVKLYLQKQDEQRELLTTLQVPGLPVGGVAVGRDIAHKVYEPGVYTLVAVADDAEVVPEQEQDRQNNEWSRSIDIELNQNAKPDLVPVEPTEADELLVLTDSQGDSVAEVLAGAQVFFDFAATNAGNAHLTEDFSTELFLVDSAGGSELLGSWTADGLDVGSITSVHDSLRIVDPGEYTLRAIIDSADEIAEQDESNNLCEANILVQHNPDAKPNLTFYTPSGWSGVFTLSNAPGGDAISDPELVVGQTAYLNYAFTNDGTAHILSGFRALLEVIDTDNQQTVDTVEFLVDSQDVGSVVVREDYELGIYSAGNYTLRLTLDDRGRVGELDENDNVAEIDVVVVATGDAKPDLAFARPDGWDGQIVASPIDKTNADGALQTGQETFIDFAFANNGSLNVVDTPFVVQLAITGRAEPVWTREFSEIAVGAVIMIEDISWTFQEPGNYDLTVTLDGGMALDEGGDGRQNNVLSKTVSVARSPDAAPDLVKFVPDGLAASFIAADHVDAAESSDSFQAGDTIYLTLSFYNQGLDSAAPFDVKLYALHDGGAFAEINDWRITGELPINGFRTIADIEYPVYNSGEYTFRVVYDVADEVAESNESNNVDEISVEVVAGTARPDFRAHTPQGWDGEIVVSSESGTSSNNEILLAGESMFIDLAFANLGTLHSETSFVSVLSVRRSGADEILYREEWAAQGLQVNSAIIQEDVEFLPFEVGDYIIELSIDDNDEVVELNDDNNLMQKTVSVAANDQAKPELGGFVPDGWAGAVVVSDAPGNFNDDESFFAGRKFYVDFAIANTGNAHAGEFATKLYIVDLETDESTLLGAWSTAALPVGEPVVNTDVEHVVYDPGDYLLRLRIDPENQVPETDDANNVLEKTIAVVENPDAMPDLRLTTPEGWNASFFAASNAGSVTPESEFMAATPIYANFAFANYGNAHVKDSTPFATTLHAVNLDNGERTLLGQWQTPALDAAASVIIDNEQPFQIYEPGDYQLIVKVDAENDVVEIGEDNNVAVVDITVLENAEAHPDLTSYSLPDSDNPLFVSTETDVYSGAQTLLAGTQLYAHLAFVNGGSAAIADGVSFATKLILIDKQTDESVELGVWSTEAMAVNEYKNIVNINGDGLRFLEPGDYTLRCFLDSSGEIEEANENNNVFDFDFTVSDNPDAAPDVAVYTPQNWDAPVIVSSSPGSNNNVQQVLAGADFYIDAAIQNQGTKNIAQGFECGLFLVDSENNEQRLATLNAAPIETSRFIVFEDVTAKIIEPGDYTLKLVLDENGDVAESDVGGQNNVYERSLQIGFNQDAKPNLHPGATSAEDVGELVASLATGDSVHASQIPMGETVYVDFNLGNSGAAHVGGDEFTCRLLLVDENNETVVLNSWPIDEIAVGQILNYNDVPIRILEEGIYKLQLIIDYDDVITESREDDNMAERTVEVVENVGALGDVAFSSLAEPGEPALYLRVSTAADSVHDTADVLQGQELYIDFTFVNDGRADIAEIPFKTKLYAIDSENERRLLGTWIVTGMPLGYSSQVQNHPVTFEETGDVVLELVVDSDEDVSEENEENNIMQKSIKVHPLSVACTFDPGWNLFSFPEATDQSIAELFTAVGRGGAVGNDLVYAWDQVQNRYVVKAASSTPTPLTGYWVYLDSSFELVLDRQSISSETLTLNRGWNLVGVPFEADLPTDQRIKMIVGWNGVELLLLDNARNGGIKLVPGRAYWFYCLEDNVNLQL